MIDTEGLQIIRSQAHKFLKGKWDKTVSIGKLREPATKALFTVLLDSAGRMIFVCAARDAEYKTLKGFVHPYAFPTDKGWVDMDEAEQAAVMLAGSPPFILLFIDDKGVFEHILLNPTGSLLWALRFAGWNLIHPYQEPFDSMMVVQDS